MKKSQCREVHAIACQTAAPMRWKQDEIWTQSGLCVSIPSSVSVGNESNKGTYLYSTYCGEGNGTPLQYSCLENPMDGGAWWAAVHGVAKSQTQLSDFSFTFHFPALEKDTATDSSALAWRIPGTGEPGGLPSMALHRVRHDWSDLAAAASKEWVER